MAKSIRKLFRAVILVAVIQFPLQAQNWFNVSPKDRHNISGMALIEQKGESLAFLIVHDNKDQFSTEKKGGKTPKTERVGLLTIENNNVRPNYKELKWISKDGTQNNLPIDLEAISAVPNMPNRFIAAVGNPREVDAKGKVYLIELDAKRENVRVLEETKFPVALENKDFEGFAVQKIDDVLVAAWAERGGSEKPATLFFGELDLSKFTLKLTGEVPILTDAPSFLDLAKYPKTDLRSISDLKIDASGAVFVTSAIDGEDYGIFASEFFYIGAFFRQNAVMSFTKTTKPIRLQQFNYFKAEAFEFVPGRNGGVIFGSDDEEFGASVYMNWR